MTNNISLDYSAVVAGFDERDVKVLQTAVGEISGFDGEVIKHSLSAHGVDVEELRSQIHGLRSPDQFSELSSEDLLKHFFLCSLVSAALGDEELQTITGYTRDEYYLTIRRLYHSVRMATKNS